MIIWKVQRRFWLWPVWSDVKKFTQESAEAESIAYQDALLWMLGSVDKWYGLLFDWRLVGYGTSD